MKYIANSSGDDIAAPLDASYYKGQGLRQGIEREFLMMETYPKITGTLCASGYAKLGTQEALNGMYVIQPIQPGDKQMPNYYTMQSFSEYSECNAASTVKCRDYKGFTDLVQEDHMEQQQKKYVLRRLTPTECARLQGFPDWWCDGANGSDSAQYKLWGNGIALPCAVMILQNIAKDAMKGENK